MGKTRISIHILPEEYDSFLRLALGDERFPQTYDEWIERRAQENAQCVARSDTLNEIVIHQTEFTEYCRATGQKPSYVMLEAMAVKKSRQP